MTETANLGMPFIEGSQAQKHITHNEALRILDGVIQIGVLDTALTAPPSSPTEGARYIVAASATGDWADHDDTIATFEDGAWRFLMPKLGWCAWSAADEAIFVFDGTVWRDLHDVPMTLAGTSSVGVNATASAPNLLTVHSNAVLFYAIDSADSGTGDARLQISREGSTNTASVVFSDDFSGRAEFGLVESDAFKLKVSDDGATFVEALAIDQATGNATLPRGVALTGVIAPPQLTAGENDYAPTGLESASVVRLSTDAVYGITGLAGGAEGRVLCLINAGAFAVTLNDENAGSTAANRFGFGTDLTLAASQGALLIYDGNAARWRLIGGPSASSGGSGGAGAMDSERQNALLALVYQSRACAEYRRVVNLFATGFKGADDTANGIDSGSSNYSVDSAAGFVSPTTTAGSDVSPTMTSNTAPSPYVISASAEDASGNLGPAWRVSDNSVASGFGWRAVAGAGSWWEIDFGSSTSVASYTMTSRSDSASNQPTAWTLQASATGSFSGEQTIIDTQSGVTWSGGAGEAKAFALSGPENYRYYRLAFSSVNGGSSIVLSEIRFFGPASANNMTVVTTAQAADAGVSNGRVLLEYDSSASPALNTDLTVEVSCDGGTNWSFATLSAITSYSQGGRKVAETVDTACTAGTSFAARIKTQNGKDVKVYGATVSVR
jgi:hypothetical protein